jgi:hypothetical protein
MNTNSDDMSLNDASFDRLVDGELGEEERRQLLANLDGEPGGWRRCALAFLESQCWQQVLGRMSQENVPRATPARPMRVSRARWSGHLSTLAAMAACFLVAFWVGSRVQQMRRELPGVPGGMTGELARTVPVEPTRIVPSQPERSLAGMMPAASNPWRMVTVAAPAGQANAGSALQVPAVERERLDPQWLRSLPPAIPDDVMQALSRTGHRIDQHRELVPVPLQDGRQLVMPVDQVKVHYVGNGTY